MFNNRITYWAEKKGIKHKHLAQECEVSIQTFSRWANNKTQPDLKQSAIIARRLGVSLDDLVLWEEKE
ncbi:MULTISPECIES: helix-turn-helix transcriptional regulator [Bacillaceae]|jgi:transcriptional regulator with XRE-family HTH domain|uniref:helix-turn-helix transcriptional regulator n=1 Tax=Bacillaceae TaxID=186817 RepID=UPI001248992E|nr:helix-turn-helix transcriptional regulator [Robertmurraya sp. DFI.2.37]MDF1511060.1 helix-turn-helix transcriptional regulator [Robertmurraya sp. DFI.2.37]QIW89328.1 host cell surface-exposed lipoprotein [Bacillus phage vB_Bacillus_1020A]